MLKIGEFSKLAQVSVKTLRYYDELGLFCAEWVDRFTGYRYYSLEQMPRLHRILVLRDLGFSLVQIEQLLRDEQDVDHLRKLMALRRAELEDELNAQQMRLQRITARLRLIEEEGRPPTYDVVVKETPTTLVAGIRDTLGSHEQIAKLSDELLQYLLKVGVMPGPLAPFTAVFYTDEYQDRGMDVELTAPLPRPLREAGRVRVHELGGAPVTAAVVHQGAYDRLPDAYRALLEWRQANGYRTSGPSRERYLQGLHAAADNDERITELQQPVQAITSTIHIRGKDDQPVEPVIMKKDAFTVVGLPFTGLLSHEPFEEGKNNEIGDLWDVFNERRDEVKHATGPGVGLCFAMPNEKEPWYIAGAEVERVEAVPEGMVSREVPAQTYAIFPCTLETLGETYRHISEDWQARSGRRHTGGPDFEYYDRPFDPAHPEKMELSVYWPIEGDRM